MPIYKLVIFFGFFTGIYLEVSGQRTYKSSSVLSSGNWYQLAVNQRGVFKVDIPFLNSLGINTSNLASGSVRLYGNGGRMLPEANNISRIDDLQENSIFVEDGGDGILNGNDYILFYADGPDQWIPDSANRRFSHIKNLYSDRSIYFLTIGGNGLRISTAVNSTPANIQIAGFSERYFHELDSVNFLSSGKEWYGEEFANAPGKSLSRSFSVNIPHLQAGSPLSLVTRCVSRSTGNASAFTVRLNNSWLGQMSFPAVSGGLYDLYAQETDAEFSVPAAPANMVIGFTYQPGSFNAQGWLNWFELFCRGNLSLSGTNQLLFRDWLSVNSSNTGEFVINNAQAGTQVWEITDPLHPVKMQTVFSGSETRFINNCHRLREYVAFNPAGFLIPTAVGPIPNQDLHQSSPADYLIVTVPAFLPQAQRLAQIHGQRSGIRTKIVSTDQVFNEFGSGSPDPVAIRDFVKMYYDKYNSNPADKLRYLLLFGDASFDYRNRLNINTNLVPAFESKISADPLSSYTSDDFFGFLDDQEDISATNFINYLDVGIGRVPAGNAEEAKNFVDKIEIYLSSPTQGDWRNDLTFIADDEDYNLHLQDAEVFTHTVTATAPVFNLRKNYLDAFQQESGPGGSRYPRANLAVNNQVQNGTLIWNYTGHGSARKLADEDILDQDIINGWNNPLRLPLIITATCDFAPYDNPVISSLGENLLLRPKTGAVALMTTTRAVFAFSNRIMNNNYLQFAFQRDAAGRYKTLGEAVMEAKNFTYQNSGDIINNRKFTLLGDPALTLAFPSLKIRATRINGVPVSLADTLSAEEKVIIEGEITDFQDNSVLDFNGSVYPTVFDKEQTVNTLANDATSQPVSFSTWASSLFKGRASVANGKFSFAFKVPRDINYSFGQGKLSLYAGDGTRDGHGFFSGFVIGGAGNGTGNDRQGPVIKAYLNDESFINGGWTNPAPLLIIKLADSSGINATGAGIGHDIVAVLDNDNRRFFILNDYYKNDLDSYQKGEARFQLPALPAGPHQLKIKAWDVLNNSGEYYLDFLVAEDDELVIKNVLNYPNPFTTKTTFWFEHNRPLQNLYVNIQIFTLSGKLIKMINQTINTPGNRSCELEWDGKDNYGNRVGRGVYLYKLSVTAPGGGKKEKIEKIVIF